MYMYFVLEDLDPDSRFRCRILCHPDYLVAFGAALSPLVLVVPDSQLLEDLLSIPDGMAIRIIF